MSAWADIRTAMSDLFTAVNVESVNAFYESPMGIEVSRLPRSPKLNGAYSVHLNGIPGVELDVNPTICHKILVRVQVGFVMNLVENADPDDGALQNEKLDYTNAVQDILLIINTFMLGQYPAFEIKDFSRASDLRPLDAAENYFVCDLEFLLGLREQ